MSFTAVARFEKHQDRREENVTFVGSLPSEVYSFYVSEGEAYALPLFNADATAPVASRQFFRFQKGAVRGGHCNLSLEGKTFSC